MNYFLNKLVINGAKNIDKPIELLFSNITISSNIDYSNSNVKAIYGPNGSGKSGIVAAMYIYKRLILDNDGINDKYFSRFIYETINKKTNVLSIDIVFSLNDSFNKKCHCFRHEIDISAINDNIAITKEKISILKGKTIKDENFKQIILVENGNLVKIKENTEFNIMNNALYLNSLNLLDKHSITISILKTVRMGKGFNYDDHEVLDVLCYIINFAYTLVIQLNKEDAHTEYISKKLSESNLNNEEKINETLENIRNNIPVFNLSTQYTDIVMEKDYSKYEKYINKLTDFIKLFKPSLDEIMIDKKIYEDKFYCKKIFRYNDIKIDIEFESTGIRKLVMLYTTLRLCANGCITFIDEMDANLHDVYFAKIIEFFKNDGKGQLCFTTHNLEPIDILKSNSHSLDFISNDSRIYSWTKNGNKSPLNKYVNGLIPYSPFNIESFDFDVLLNED